MTPEELAKLDAIDTPRMDACDDFTVEEYTPKVYRLFEEGRKLERELLALTAERDALKSEIEHIKKALSNANDVRVNMLHGSIAWTEAGLLHVLGIPFNSRDEVRAVMTERDALREDKERLDWLELSGSFPKMIEASSNLVARGMGEFTPAHTWRAAIDAARKEKP